MYNTIVHIWDCFEGDTFGHDISSAHRRRNPTKPANHTKLRDTARRRSKWNLFIAAPDGTLLGVPIPVLLALEVVEVVEAGGDVGGTEGEGTESDLVGLGVEEAVKILHSPANWLSLNGACSIQQEKHSDDIEAVAAQSHCQSLTGHAPPYSIVEIAFWSAS